MVVSCLLLEKHLKHNNKLRGALQQIDDVAVFQKEITMLDGLINWFLTKSSFLTEHNTAVVRTLVLWILFNTIDAIPIKVEYAKIFLGGS